MKIGNVSMKYNRHNMTTQHTIRSNQMALTITVRSRINDNTVTEWAVNFKSWKSAWNDVDDYADRTGCRVWSLENIYNGTSNKKNQGQWFIDIEG